MYRDSDPMKADTKSSDDRVKGNRAGPGLVDGYADVVECLRAFRHVGLSCSISILHPIRPGRSNWGLNP